MLKASTKSASQLLAHCIGTAAFVVALPLHAAGLDCGETDKALAYWRPIREQAADADLPADSLAADLVSCLGSANPELRDRIGYELFTYWLRQEKLSNGARHSLLAALHGNLSADQTLLRSFSALILAELMRSDANDAFMDNGERNALLDSAAQAIAAETDFRGLEPDIGWVHPVAHMADLLWRFALHPATDSEQSVAILAAVGEKVAPVKVAYAFNEGDRLARVVATLIQRELLDPRYVADWISDFQSPKSMEKWSDAFAHPAGMAELHNTKQFLRALSDQLDGVDVDDAIAEPLAELIAGFTALI